MKKESFEVFNPGNTNISLTLKQISMIAPIVEMASHHRRRANRGRRIDVSVPAQHVVDLVKVTEFSVADIEANQELRTYLNNGRLIHVKPENQEQLVITESVLEVPEATFSENEVKVTEDSIEVLNKEEGSSTVYDRESLEVKEESEDWMGETEEDPEEPSTDKETVEDEILEGMLKIEEPVKSDFFIDDIPSIETEEKIEEPVKKKYKPKTVSKRGPSRKKKA